MTQGLKIIEFGIDPVSGENSIHTQVTCISCKKDYSIYMTPEQNRQYTRGESYVQKIFPELDSGIRELLVSGTCGECFDKMFGDDE